MVETYAKCTSIRPLVAAAATRVDASSASAASVYSCSACRSMLDPPEDRKVSFLARPNMSTVDVTHSDPHLCMVETNAKCRSIRPLVAAAATRVDASSASAASVYSCSAC